MKRFEITYIDKEAGNIYPMITVVHAIDSQTAIKILSNDNGRLMIIDVKETRSPDIRNVS